MPRWKAFRGRRKQSFIDHPLGRCTKLTFCTLCSAPSSTPPCQWATGWAQGQEGCKTLSSWPTAISLKAKSPKLLMRLGPQKWQLAQVVAGMNLGRTNSFDTCCCILGKWIVDQLFPMCKGIILLPPYKCTFFPSCMVPACGLAQGAQSAELLYGYFSITIERGSQGALIGRQALPHLRYLCRIISRSLCCEYANLP